MTAPTQRPTVDRCITTGNPCGTDTVLVGRECSANEGVCIRRLERQRAALAEMLARTVDCLHDCRLRDEAHALLAELDESNQRKEVK